MDEIARVRRSPKFGVWLGLGAALGLIAALILTFAFDGTAEVSANTGLEYSQGQVFGFLCLFCIPIGIALAGVAAVVTDRVLAKRAHDVHVDHERIHPVD